MAEPFVQPQAYDAEGHPVAPDAAADAVASGKAFFQKGQRVYATNSRGELVTVDAAEASRPGYRVLSQGELEAAAAKQQYGEGLGNVAKAGAAGFARGLTLGASDAALSAVGGEDTRKALKGLREANPITSVTSEIGGAVAPVLLSGGSAAPVEAAEGASLLARGGQAASGAIRALGAGHRAIAGAGSIVEQGVARGLEALGANGATALGRAGIAAAKLGARGAAEGALYGAAQSANDSVLNGDDITAEKLIAGMGHGALFGGALGAGIGGGSKLLGEGLERLVPKKEALKQLARDQALDAAGFTGPQRGKLMGRATGKAGQERLDATADDLLETALQTGERKGQRVLEPGANVGETLEKISQAKNEFGAQLAGVKKELSDRMAAAGENPDVGEFLARVQKEVIDPLKSSKSPGAMSKARAVEKELSILRAEHEAATAVDELDALGLENTRYLRNGYRDQSLEITRSAYKGATPEEAQLIALGKAPPKFSPKHLEGKTMEPVRVEIWPGEAPALGDGRHRMLAAKEAGADSVLANVVKYDAEGNAISEVLRPVSITPRTAVAGPSQTSLEQLDAYRQRLAELVYPQAPTTGGIPAPPPKAVKYLEKTERILADYIKENAANALAKAGEDPNAFNELNRKYSSFRKLEQVAGKAEQMALGRRGVSPSDHALGMTSFLGALATGNVGALGAMGYGAAAAAANKLLRERGNSLVATLARRASETDNVIDSAAKALAGTGEKVKAPALTAAFEGEGLREQYQKTAERVRELAQPAIAAQHISGVIPEVAAQYPNVGAAVSRKLLAIYQELSKKLPPSHVDTGTTLTPLAIKERVSPVQQRKFLNSVTGALHPEKVIADLGRGIVNRDAIDMMKTVHPLMFQQLRTQVAKTVQGREKEIPFQRRIMLSTVFEFVGDSSLEPTRFTALQQMTKAMTIQDAAKDAQAVKPKQSPNPNSAADMGEAFALPAQGATGDL